MSFNERVEAANRLFTNRRRNQVINSESASKPRFELYHAAPSLCSMKVRMVLAELDVPWMSHDLNLMGRSQAPECYLPDYVRLRMLGAPEAEFALGYTGQSSVTTEGFDPCVVPTLVDHESQQVVVDSARICSYLDQQCGHALVPENLTREIGAQIDTVDRAPHVASLYGAHPDNDRRPRALATNIDGVHARKIHRIEQLKRQTGEDAELIAAYDAKIAKEAAASTFVYDPDSMRSAHEAMAAHVANLDAQLAESSGDWALGKAFTLADVMWIVSLYRMAWLGMEHAWTGAEPRARVASYLERGFHRPSFQSAVIHWPFAYAPGPNTPEFSGIWATIKFVVEMLRRGE